MVLVERRPEQYLKGHLAEAIHVDFYGADCRTHVASLDRERPFILYCRSDSRNRRMMQDYGFTSVYDIVGSAT